MENKIQEQSTPHALKVGAELFKKQNEKRLIDLETEMKKILEEEAEEEAEDEERAVCDKDNADI